MGKTGGREEGDLLSSGNGALDIDTRDSGLDHLRGVVSGEGVDGLPRDIEALLSQNGHILTKNMKLIQQLEMHLVVQRAS